MSLKFACPCGKKFTVSDDRAGMKAVCSNCDATLRLPTHEAMEQYHAESTPTPSSKKRILFTCTCGAEFNVAARFAGKKVVCKSCNTKFRVPASRRRFTAEILIPGDPNNASAIIAPQHILSPPKTSPPKEAAAASTTETRRDKNALSPPAEKDLPPGLCPLIKSTYGYYCTQANPFLEMADVIVAETTCDGKKKMYELMAERKEMYILELPQKPDDPDAKEHWFRELCKFRDFLRTRYNCTISDDDLREAIAMTNGADAR